MSEDEDTPYGRGTSEPSGTRIRRNKLDELIEIGPEPL